MDGEKWKMVEVQTGTNMPNKNHYSLTNPKMPNCQNDAHFLKSYFEIILLGWLCAVHRLNAAHFEGLGVWLSFISNFYKDGTPLDPPSVHHCVHHILCTQGPGWSGLKNGGPTLGQTSDDNKDWSYPFRHWVFV